MTEPWFQLRCRLSAKAVLLWIEMLLQADDAAGFLGESSASHQACVARQQWRV